MLINLHTKVAQSRLNLLNKQLSMTATKSDSTKNLVNQHVNDVS